MYGYCTNSDRWGCYRAGKDGLLPPVMSGKLKSKSTITFGEVTVCARVPRGDWIWPGYQINFHITIFTELAFTLSIYV
jgi:hypothetical protein